MANLKLLYDPKAWLSALIKLRLSGHPTSGMDLPILWKWIGYKVEYFKRFPPPELVDLPLEGQLNTLPFVPVVVQMRALPEQSLNLPPMEWLSLPYPRHN